MTTLAPTPEAPPVAFGVDYPDRPLDRLSTAFRPLLAVPILIVLAAVSGSTVATAGGVLFLAPLLMIVFARRYPRWWFEWNLQLLRFTARVGAYLALLDDRYPSTEDEQAVHLELRHPDVARGDVNQLLPLVKWFLAIPHYVVLSLLWLGVVVAVIAVLGT
jgi:hypothetical protein